MFRGRPATVSIRLAVLLAASCGRTDLEVSVALPIVDASVPDVKDSAVPVDTSRPPPPCVPGEQVACACPGGASGVKDCVADGGGFGVCHGCADLDAGPPPKDAGNDAACTPGTTDCVGATPEICTAAGQWQLEPSCGDGLPFCLEGTCVTCSPGTTVCSSGSNGNLVLVCSTTGTWEPGTTCAQPRPECSHGACACLETECASGCVDVQTDPKNCGACGHDCLGGACAGGFCQPVTLVSGQGDPWSLASDGTYVYWVDRAIGDVAKVPVDGGAVTTLASGGESPVALAIDGQNVYWVDSEAGTVSKVGLAGGTVTTLASDPHTPLALAIDGQNVYWIDAARAVQSVPIAGGQSATLATAPLVPSSIAADGVNVYWTGQLTPVGGAVLSVARAGGAVTTLATESLVTPMGLAVGGGNAYWTSLDPAFELPLDSTVSTVPTSGGATLVLASGESSVGEVAFDGTSVFWTNNDFGSSAADSSVERLLLGTTVPTAAAEDQTFVTCVAVDALRVYWGALGNNPPQTGTILAVAK